MDTIPKIYFHLRNAVSSYNLTSLDKISIIDQMEKIASDLPCLGHKFQIVPKVKKERHEQGTLHDVGNLKEEVESDKIKDEDTKCSS